MAVPDGALPSAGRHRLLRHDDVPVGAGASGHGGHVHARVVRGREEGGGRRGGGGADRLLLLLGATAPVDDGSGLRGRGKIDVEGAQGLIAGMINLWEEDKGTGQVLFLFLFFFFFGRQHSPGVSRLTLSRFILL